jgi:hypothetical protein
MFRFLQSIFKIEQKKGDYTESLVKEAIERAVDGTDPSLRIVSGYKRKLRPAVVAAIEHVNALVEGLPPPRPVALGIRGDDPLIRAFFISLDEMRKVFGNDRNLTNFIRSGAAVPEKVTALLLMEKVETAIFSAEISGDVVERDVPLKHVGFDAHRIIAPAGDESETRRLLKGRAYDHLVSLALRRITTMKTEREDLKRRHVLLQSKLDIFQRHGWGFEKAASAGSPDIAGLEEEIGRIESQLLEMGGDDRTFENYLDILVNVLGSSGEHLWGKTETLILDSMGIRRDQFAHNANELTFHELFNSEGRSLVALPVALDGREARSICG